MDDANYGDLKGASIGLEMEASGNITTPPTPPALQSPISDTSPDTPKSPITTTAATSSTLVPANMKPKLVEFCGKNKLPLPEFKRQTTVPGAYTTKLTWTPAGSEDTEYFVTISTKPTKKEAENAAAADLYQKLQEYMDSNKQAELGNSKGELQQLVAKNSQRFGVPKYETAPTGISTFASSLCVTDLLTGEVYNTSGKGIGKKTAEKDASKAMLAKLSEVISCSPTEEPGMGVLEKLVFRLKSLVPSHSTDWIPVPNSEEEKCFLKTFYLLLRKEGASDVILGYGSGMTDEEAMQRCADGILPHLGKLAEFFISGEERTEDST